MRSDIQLSSFSKVSVQVVYLHIKRMLYFKTKLEKDFKFDFFISSLILPNVKVYFQTL